MKEHYIYDITQRDIESLKTYLQNIWKKEKGKNGVLISGLSGCGKTTLTKQLKDWAEEKYPVEVITMDKFILNGKGDKFIENWYNTEGVRHKKTDWYDVEIYKTDVYFDFFVEFFEYIIRYIQNNPEKLIIVEGIQIFYKEVIEHIKAKGLPFPIILLKENRVQMLKNLIDRNEEVMLNGTVDEKLAVIENYLKWNERNYENFNELYNLVTKRKGRVN